MGELYNPFPKLPKNIVQIGERDQIVKLYVEDYVNTYLKHLYPLGGQDLRAGLLLGSVELNDGTPYIFIDGAMEMEDVTEAGGKVVFSELAWKKASQSMEQLFPKRTIQGWFLCGRPGDELSPLNYWKQHVQYFEGPNKLMYLSTGREGEESIYITSEDGFYKLQGYSLYYERNQMMQDYMVLRKDVKRIETESDDKVIAEFRKRMDEHKSEVTEKHQTSGLLRGLCTAMSVVILAGAIVLFNNYEHMRKMESVITSAIPEKAEKLLKGNKEVQKETKGSQGVIVEEAAGEVYPTGAVEKETMDGVKPEKQQSIDQPLEALMEEEQQIQGQQGQNQQAQTQNQQAKDQQEQNQQTADQEKKSETQAKENGSTTSKETAAASGDGRRVHIVQEGETLYGICIAEYHTVNKLQELCELNGLDDENKIVSGQKLLLP